MRKFKHIPTDEAINSLIANKQVIMPTGAFFGDEAKGKTVDSIASHPSVSVIARPNSGANAGHTVFHENNKYVFHLLPSAVFTGKKNVIHNNAVMDPNSFFHEEIKQIKKAEFPTDNIFIGNVSIVFPWHKIADCLRDPNASTGKGMSQIHSDKSCKIDLSLEDIINGRYDLINNNLDEWWKKINPKLNDKTIELLIKNNKQKIDIEKFLTADNHKVRIDLVKNAFEGEVMDFLKNHYANTSEIMINELEKGNKILLEGPQSYYLSNSVDTHHNSSTSADTHATGIFAASNLPPKYTNHALTINIHKAPGSSRVGKGANPSGHVDQDWFNHRNLKKEDLPTDIPLNRALNQFVEEINEMGLIDDFPTYKREDGTPYVFNGTPLLINESLAISEVVTYGEFGSTTGKPRITGALDLPHLKNLKKFQQGKLSISCVDRGDGLDHALLVVGYNYQGEEYNYMGKNYVKGAHISLEDSLPGENVLKNCQPIYEVMDGWKSAKSLEDNLQKYLGRIEELTGMTIISIGIGPKTHEIMYLK